MKNNRFKEIAINWMKVGLILNSRSKYSVKNVKEAVLHIENDKSKVSINLIKDYICVYL